jgi:hypothetical protein
VPSIAPINSEGAKTPPGAADPHRQAGRQHLREQQSEQRQQQVVAGDGAFEHRVADAVHLRHGQQQQAEQDPARRRAQPVRAAPQAIGRVLAFVEHADERHPDQRRERAEPGVEHEFERR